MISLLVGEDGKVYTTIDSVKNMTLLDTDDAPVTGDFLVTHDDNNLVAHNDDNLIWR